MKRYESANLFSKELLNKYPVLSREESAALMAAKKTDKSARDKAILSNLRYVLKTASQFYCKFPDSDLEMLISVGMEALVRAVDNFDCDFDNGFLTYARWVIPQAIYKFASEQKTEFSLDEKIYDDDDSTFRDNLIDESAVTEKAAMNSQLKALFEKTFEDFSEREVKVIKMAFGWNNKKPMTLAEISERVGVSKQRVDQIKHEVLKKMALPKYRKIFEGFVA